VVFAVIKCDLYSDMQASVDGKAKRSTFRMEFGLTWHFTCSILFKKTTKTLPVLWFHVKKILSKSVL